MVHDTYVASASRGPACPSVGRSCWTKDCSCKGCEHVFQMVILLGCKVLTAFLPRFVSPLCCSDVCAAAAGAAACLGMGEEGGSGLWRFYLKA